MPRDNILKTMFLITLAITLLVPVIDYQFVHVSFNRLLVQNTEEEAQRAAGHLQSMLLSDVSDLTKDALSDHFAHHAGMAKNDFGFTGLRLFSKEGEIIYSADSSDTGEINSNAYFHKIVAGGKTYSKFIKRDTGTFEGGTIKADVVETYVPLMKEGAFTGAFEISYDITERHNKLNKAVLYFSILPSLMMLCFFVVISITIFRLDRNIIERKRVETELILNAEKLRISNRELQEFVSIASHDLQEPLRKVTAFGGRFRTGYAHVLDEKGLDYLERMMNSAKRMQELINGLLSFSRVTTKAQPFVPVDLSRVTKEVLADLEVRIEQTGGHVEVSDLPTLDADPLQMRQLFQNLISNALKFHKTDSPPEIKISGTFVHNNENDPPLLRPDGESCQITVEDNGIGFDNKYAERIFGVFQRLHGRQEYEGTGIGLSICRKIVERHGGTISAMGMPGEGAKFIVTLPVRQAC
ncbi:MAG: hypothetical protein C4526_07910 [Nitrospiraceae bacterium]|nr:MAG: hypothetical protein C4526_07910 [Nitrospiraceae bacterium]